MLQILHLQSTVKDASVLVGSNDLKGNFKINLHIFSIMETKWASLIFRSCSLRSNKLNPQLDGFKLHEYP